MAMLSMAGPPSPSRPRRKRPESLQFHSLRETTLREQMEREDRSELWPVQQRQEEHPDESSPGGPWSGRAGWGRDQTGVLIRYPQGGREVRPCSRVEDLSWAPELASYLRSCGVRECSPVQSLLWPAVSQLRSVVAVAGRAQGKTVGWLLPLLAQVWQPYSSLVPGSGPLAVVLCSSQDEAAAVAARAAAVLAGSGHHLRVAATGPQSGLLYNGCHLLCTSAPRLVELLEQGAVSMARCCHLVVESSHLTLHLQHLQVEEVLLTWRRCRTPDPGLPDQVVVVGEEWSPALASLTSRVLPRWRPVLLLASLPEAVLYSGLSVLPLPQTSQEAKLASLLQLLHQRPSPMALCCSSESWHTALRIGRIGVNCTNTYPKKNRRQNTGIIFLSNLFINSI